MEQEQLHKINKALSDPRRFEILQHIAQGEEVACSELRSDFPITAATLSHHLKELCNAGLIDMRKEAKFVHMKLRRKIWKEYLRELKRL